MMECLTVGPLGVNCYVLSSNEPGCCVLVDPGDEASRILSFMAEKNVQPCLILLTHGHLDHTAAIPDIVAAQAARGRTVRIAAHELDAQYFGPEGEETNRRVFADIGVLSYFKKYWRPLPAVDLVLRDGASIPGLPFTVIHTPGHTRGSICLYNQADGVLLSGDTLFFSGVGRSDGQDSDPRDLDISLGKLAELPPDTEVYPGHGGTTTIGRETGG